MADKAPNIGLSQARRLCQMQKAERVAFIADGLPIVLASAQGFWLAARQLDGRVREAVVLERHAEEEAAKVLILMDMVRCPERLVSSRMGSMVTCFYSHLARLIYAEAAGGKPTDVVELRKYVDMDRKSHHVDGPVGEYIMPNSTIFNREGMLYSDIAAYEDEEPRWSDPMDLLHPLSFSGRPPTVLRLAESMSRLGMFKQRGIEITGEVWGKVEFKKVEGFREANSLTRTLLKVLIDEGLPTDEADQEDVELLYEAWPLPMYHLDFGMIQVPLQDLQKEQERILWREIGGGGLLLKCAGFPKGRT